MTKLEAIKELESLQNIDDDINNAKEQLQSFLSSINLLKSSDSELRVSGGELNKKETEFINLMERINYQKIKYADYIFQKQNLMWTINEKLGKLQPIEERILREYYSYGKSLDEIAEDENYSYSQTFNLKATALIKYCNIS